MYIENIILMHNQRNFSCHLYVNIRRGLYENNLYEVCFTKALDSESQDIGTWTVVNLQTDP